MKKGISHLLILVSAVLLTPQTVSAATLSLVATNGSVVVGDRVTVAVRVSSTDQAMNAVAGTLSFPTDLLSVSSVSRSSSVLTLWIQDPSFSNVNGTIDFSGVVPNPGYIGTAGQVMSVTFIARKAGTATIKFFSSSVLANDGKGTNILTTAAPTSVTVKQAAPVTVPSASAPTSGTTSGTVEDSELLAVITSSTHPDQTKWYDGSRVVLDWMNAQGVSAVRLGYDTNAEGIPGVLYNEPISHKELQLNDGIWYFHVREKGPSGWGPVSTFRIQIDTVPPAPIVIEFPNGNTTATSTIAVTFATIDALSGIDYYQLAVDGNKFNVDGHEGDGVYSLPALPAGTHTLVVTAYDKAQNTVSAEQQFTTIGVAEPSAPAWNSLAWLIANYLSLILLAFVALAAIVFSGWYLSHRFHTFRKRVVNKEERMHLLIHRQFNELKNAVADEVAALEHIKSKRNLTIEEERLIGHLQKLINQSEVAIEKELESVLGK